MDSSTRHRFIESPGSVSTPLPVHARPGRSDQGVAPHIWAPVENGAVHRVRGESLRPSGTERSEPRAVADQRCSSPVGYRTKADIELDVQREGRLPDQRPRD